MENLNLPDAINCSDITSNFAQIPNYILRSNELSATSKVILGILLSNQYGWHSYITTLNGMMSEGQSAINSAILQLEELDYLRRYRYRDKVTKKWVGSFWAYNSISGIFNIHEQIEQIEKNGGEIYYKKQPITIEKAIHRKPICGKPIYGKSKPNNINNNNTNNLRLNTLIPDKKIIPNKFDFFWKRYPNKGGKGSALTSWNKLCTKKDRPEWWQIKTAVENQKESEQWKDPQFIPLASTWLNNSKWLDDPSLMKGSYKREIQPNFKVSQFMPPYKYVGTIRYTLNTTDGEYYHKNGDKYVE